MINIEKYKDYNNIYAKLWEEYTNKQELPKYYRDIIEVNYHQFKENIFKNDLVFAKNLTKSLLKGDIYILKNTFSNSYIKKLKQTIAADWNNKNSSFHKIYENCPNFYRNITKKLAKNYSFQQIKETQYFFPWNNDIYEIYSQVYKKWRVLKYISGYHQNAWENNTPKDGIVDRIQIVRYPPKQGKLELHQDPHHYQKFFISIYMSKKNLDYFNGGMYFINPNYKKYYLDDNLHSGDLAFGLATIYHGVDESEVPKSKENNKVSGRWFMGLYTTESDYSKNRHTGRSMIDINRNN